MTAARGLFVGLATLDVAQHVEVPPGPDEKVTATATHLSAGGPAANAAVAFAALGGEATLLTALGRSPAAALVRAELEQQRVRVVDASPDDVGAPPVSTIVVAATTGQRSVVGSDAVASTAAAPSDAGLGALLEAADVVLVDGHHPRLAVAVGSAARGAGVPVVLDLGRWKPVMEELVPLVDAVVCSADARAPGTVDVVASAAALRRLGAGTVVVTRGGAPVLWWEGGRTGTVGVPDVVAVDTLGAGDAFHGAYAYAVAHGADVDEAVALGVRVATLRVQHAGPRAWAAGLASDGGGPA
ncbi:PfkB family carbohydrate kinase [Serinibacter arcticus]|uniref:Kinase, pfkB family protein n=1 Tax=Serinibacter arcticus TaxID=1655435 RepID=A0A4Z1EB50_9MICO|nr:PfkB family carbohydrate kinase [Serinibacter arcticus]TGO06707.1 kinase, pfkB family protein [Serinibacter arcticus]